MTKPDFICVGAHKAGTRALYDMLSTHSDVWMPPVKEINYFNKPIAETRTDRLKRQVARLARTGANPADLEFFKRLLNTAIDGRRSIADYQGLFAPAGNLVTGDVSPVYATLSYMTVQQLAEAMPELKAFFVVREPLSRLWSHARHYEERTEIRVTSDEAAFRQFLETPEVRSLAFQSVPILIWSYYFATRFHLFQFEELSGDAQVYYRRLCAVLGIDPDRRSSNQELGYNRKAKEGLPWPKTLRTIAQDYLADEPQRLEALVRSTLRAEDFPA